MTTGLPRLANLSVGARVPLTLFLLLIGVGYIVALQNIVEHHEDADLEPGLSLDDLRRVYHGLDKEVTSETRRRRPSTMEKMTGPGGLMRKQLEKGGEPAIRTLTSWLKAGAEESDFARPGAYRAGDPSARQVIANQCIRCHNAADGEMSDVPYAASADAVPEYALVIEVAAPRFGRTETETKTMHLAPTGRAALVQITHAHILAMPVFALIIGGLFLLTGLPEKAKLLIGPLPMAALCVELASWWLARSMGPFVYVIAAAGPLFGLSLGVQILCVFASMWFGRRTA